MSGQSGEIGLRVRLCKAFSKVAITRTNYCDINRLSLA